MSRLITPPPFSKSQDLEKGGGDLTPPPLGALAYYVCRVRPPPLTGGVHRIPRIHERGPRVSF